MFGVHKAKTFRKGDFANDVESEELEPFAQVDLVRHLFAHAGNEVIDCGVDIGFEVFECFHSIRADDQFLLGGMDVRVLFSEGVEGAVTFEDGVPVGLVELGAGAVDHFYTVKVCYAPGWRQEY